MRKDEKNALVEMCPRHYNRHLFADPAVMRKERGSHPPATAAAEGGHEFGATAAAEGGHEYGTTGETDRWNTG
jgi:hypothetical protein